MTGPLATIGRSVSFIFDPVPRCDRRATPDPRPGPMDSAFVDVMSGQSDPAGSVPSWDGLDPEVLEARHPRSSPARLRPYDWMIEHAWPVDGWVIS